MFLRAKFSRGYFDNFFVLFCFVLLLSWHSLVSLGRTLPQSVVTLPLGPHLTLIVSLEVLTANTATVALGLHHVIFEGATKIQFLTISHSTAFIFKLFLYCLFQLSVGYLLKLLLSQVTSILLSCCLLFSVLISLTLNQVKRSGPFQWDFQGTTRQDNDGSSSLFLLLHG